MVKTLLRTQPGLLIGEHLYSKRNKIPERSDKILTCKRMLIKMHIDPDVNVFYYFTRAPPVFLVFTRATVSGQMRIQTFAANSDDVLLPDEGLTDGIYKYFDSGYST